MNQYTKNFLRCCLTGEQPAADSIKNIHWKDFFQFSKKQAITGIVFSGIQKLKQDVYPEKHLLMQWLLATEQIKKQNRRLNLASIEVRDKLNQHGFCYCILKGQGNALMYPRPELRMPGDIDIWIQGNREEIIQFAKEEYGKELNIRFHHVVCTTLDGIRLELHFTPGVINSFIHNRRLQQWFQQQKKVQMSNRVALPEGIGEIAIPTDKFNVIYQLSHIFHHFFDEGIGLRQIIDYYYLINRLEVSENGKKDIVQLLKRFGLYKFAGAVMFILKDLFGMEDEKLLVPLDTKRGKLLLEEILDGGNFGQYASKYGCLTKRSTAVKYFLKIYRNFHFIRYYPAEALCEPLFRTWHFFWRRQWN